MSSIRQVSLRSDVDAMEISHQRPEQGGKEEL